MPFLIALGVIATIVFYLRRAQDAVDVANGLADAVCNAGSAARRFNFRRRANVHPVEQIEAVASELGNHPHLRGRAPSETEQKGERAEDDADHGSPNLRDGAMRAATKRRPRRGHGRTNIPANQAVPSVARPRKPLVAADPPLRRESGLPAAVSGDEQ